MTFRYVTGVAPLLNAVRGLATHRLRSLSSPRHRRRWTSSRGSGLGRGIRAGIAPLALLAVASFLEAQQTAETVSRLSTPRRAIDNFLKWQLPPNVDMGVASEAFAIDPGLSASARRELARQLKAVLDARGLFVYVDDLPDEPDYTDPSSGLPSFRMFPARLPDVELVKVGDRWLFSRATLRRIPGLYDETFTGAAQWLIGTLPPLFQTTLVGIALWQYTGLFVLLLIGFTLRKTIEFFLEKLAAWLVVKTPPPWDEKLVLRAVKPLSFIAMTLLFMAFYADLQLPVQVNAALKLFLELMIAGSLIWLSFNFVDFLCEYLSRWTAKTETKLDDQLVPMLRKTLKVFAFTIGIIAVIQNYGYSVTSILAGLGIGGLAVALAAQETLANFFGSITIFVDKPFQIGDWIIADGVEGTVEEVGFRTTRVRTFYNSVVSVPNARIANANIDNMGLRRYRRIKQVLGLTYSTTAEQMQAFVEGIRAIIAANRYMRKDFYEIHFNEYGDFSLNVLVYCFLEVPNWSTELREKHNFFLEILRLAEEVGVEFAFPTRTLHIDSFYRDEPREIGKSLDEEKLARTVLAFGPGGGLSRPAGPVMELDGKRVHFPAGSTPTRGAE